jgi:hypothetical protein
MLRQVAHAYFNYRVLRGFVEVQYVDKSPNRATGRNLTSIRSSAAYRHMNRFILTSGLPGLVPLKPENGKFPEVESSFVT